MDNVTGTDLSENNNIIQFVENNSEHSNNGPLVKNEEEINLVVNIEQSVIIKKKDDEDNEKEEILPMNNIKSFPPPLPVNIPTMIVEFVQVLEDIKTYRGIFTVRIRPSIFCQGMSFVMESVEVVDQKETVEENISKNQGKIIWKWDNDVEQLVNVNDLPLGKTYKFHFFGFWYENQKFNITAQQLQQQPSSPYSLINDIHDLIISFRCLPPGPPRLFEIVGRARTELKLRWSEPLHDGGSNIIAYRVEQLAQGGKFVVVQQNGEKLLKMTKLRPGTKYTFRVCAVSEQQGIGYYSENLEATTQASVPSHPLELHESDVGPDFITMSWLPPAELNGSDISSYVLEACKNPSTERNFDIVYNGQDLWYTLGNLKSRQTVLFRIRAENQIGYSQYSDIVDVKTTGRRPGIVNNVSISTMLQPEEEVSVSGVASMATTQYSPRSNTNKYKSVIDGKTTTSNSSNTGSTQSSKAAFYAKVKWDCIGDSEAPSDYKVEIAAIPDENIVKNSANQKNKSRDSTKNNSNELEWVPVGRFPNSSCEIPALRANTNYAIRIRSFNEFGSSDEWSQSCHFKTGSCPPSIIGLPQVIDVNPETGMIKFQFPLVSIEQQNGSAITSFFISCRLAHTLMSSSILTDEISFLNTSSSSSTTFAAVDFENNNNNNNNNKSVLDTSSSMLSTSINLGGNKDNSKEILCLSEENYMIALKSRAKIELDSISPTISPLFKVGEVCEALFENDGMYCATILKCTWDTNIQDYMYECSFHSGSSSSNNSVNNNGGASMDKEESSSGIVVNVYEKDMRSRLKHGDICLARILNDVGEDILQKTTGKEIKTKVQIHSVTSTGYFVTFLEMIRPIEEIPSPLIMHDSKPTQSLSSLSVRIPTATEIFDEENLLEINQEKSVLQNTVGMNAELSKFMLDFANLGAEEWITLQIPVNSHIATHDSQVEAEVYGFTPGVLYDIRVAAMNTTGLGPFSDAFEYKIDAAPPIRPLPPKVTGKSKKTMVSLRLLQNPQEKMKIEKWEISTSQCRIARLPAITSTKEEIPERIVIVYSKLSSFKTVKSEKGRLPLSDVLLDFGKPGLWKCLRLRVGNQSGWAPWSPCTVTCTDAAQPDAPRLLECSLTEISSTSSESKTTTTTSTVGANNNNSIQMNLYCLWEPPSSNNGSIIQEYQLFWASVPYHASSSFSNVTFHQLSPPFVVDNTLALKRDEALATSRTNMNLLSTEELALTIESSSDHDKIKNQLNSNWKIKTNYGDQIEVYMIAMNKFGASKKSNSISLNAFARVPLVVSSFRVGEVKKSSVILCWDELKSHFTGGSFILNYCVQVFPQADPDSIPPSFSDMESANIVGNNFLKKLGIREEYSLSPSNSIIIKDLESNSNYCVRICAENKLGRGLFSEWISFTTEDEEVIVFGSSQPSSFMNNNNSDLNTSDVLNNSRITASSSVKIPKPTDVRLVETKNGSLYFSWSPIIARIKYSTNNEVIIDSNKIIYHLELSTEYGSGERKSNFIYKGKDCWFELMEKDVVSETLYGARVRACVVDSNVNGNEDNSSKQLVGQFSQKCTIKTAKRIQQFMKSNATVAISGDSSNNNGFLVVDHQSASSNATSSIANQNENDDDRLLEQRIRTKYIAAHQAYDKELKRIYLERKKKRDVWHVVISFILSLFVLMLIPAGGTILFYITVLLCFFFPEVSLLTAQSMWHLKETCIFEPYLFFCIEMLICMICYSIPFSEIAITPLLNRSYLELMMMSTIIKDFVYQLDSQDFMLTATIIIFGVFFIYFIFPILIGKIQIYLIKDKLNNNIGKSVKKIGKR